MTRATDTATNDLLQLDADIDALSDREVKDAWARGQFCHAVIEANGPAWMRTEDCDDFQDVLKSHNNSNLKQAALIAFGRGPFSRSLGWENGPGNVETLWAHMVLHRFVDGYDAGRTPTEKPLRHYNDIINELDGGEERLVERARSELKSACRGSGMPRIATMRSRVRTHAEESAE